MSEYESVFRRKELQDMYSSGEVVSLEDLYLVEDAALTVKDLNKEKDFYKYLKKKKKEDINDAIKVIDNKVEFYKAVMIETLKKNNEKSVKFPGSCSISSRNQKAKWKVVDEEEFIVILQEAKKAGEDVDDALEKVIQYNVRKREANKLLLMWEKSGKLEEFLKKAKAGCDIEDIVVKEPSKTIVSMSFVEKDADEDGKEVDDVNIPVKNTTESTTDVGDYDSI